VLTRNQVDELAQELRTQYDYPVLWEQFSWGGEEMPDAWNTRENLVPVAPIVDAQAAENFAEAVHLWGFNGRSIRAEVVDADAWLPAIHNLVHEWQLPQDPLGRPNALLALQNILAIQFLGIATVTKWTCFLDQDRFAIYDSRVSYAMRDLTIDNLRAFPFVGGRVTEQDRPYKVSQDACVTDPARAVTTYANFLNVIRRTASLLNEQAAGIRWNAARVECCLFVAGESRLRTPGILPLNNPVNAAFVGGP